MRYIRTMKLHKLWLLALLSSLLLVGCSETEQLGETESSEINKIFKTGVAHPDDAFVRAETFRVIELLADPALGVYAKEGLADKSSMVRVASLRATLATNPADGEAAAAQVFSRGTTDERRAVLTAVSAYEMGPGQRELLGRALRSEDPDLRRIAFEANFLQRVDEAVAAKQTKLLETSIFPELGRYVGVDKDPVLAALALEKFLEVGQTDRADPLLSALARDDLPLEKRLLAARILVWAHAKPALEPFHKIIARHDEILADQSLGIPTEIVPAAMLRLAILGTVSAGDTTHIKRAQAYVNNVSDAAAMEVLEALGPNPSPEAAVTLKVAMGDARRDVRLRAIELYEQRPDADPAALIKALKGADFETQKRLTRVLVTRFREPWVTELRSRVQRASEMENTLALLRDVVTSKEEADVLIVPMRDVFQKIVDEEKDRRASLASYFLAITAPSSEEASKIVAQDLDDPTRYAYIEYLVRTDPKGSVETFRKYFYDDLFVIRLMSAAGLWRVLGGSPSAED